MSLPLYIAPPIKERVRQPSSSELFINRTAAKIINVMQEKTAMPVTPRKQIEADLDTNLSGKDRHFYDMLREKRDQLIDQIQHLSESSLASTRQAGEELADVGSDDFMREVELALASEEERQFVLVQEAIERLHEGTYGQCIDCEEAIGDGRLEAIPYAKLCVDCKTRREENNGMPPEENEASEQQEQLVE